MASPLFYFIFFTIYLLIYVLIYLFNEAFFIHYDNRTVLPSCHFLLKKSLKVNFNVGIKHFNICIKLYSKINNYPKNTFEWKCIFFK